LKSIDHLQIADALVNLGEASEAIQPRRNCKEKSLNFRQHPAEHDGDTLGGRDKHNAVTTSGKQINTPAHRL
jgi:hypothetical protein